MLVLLILVWLLDANQNLFFLINGHAQWLPERFWAVVTTLGDAHVLLAAALVLAFRYPALLWILILAALLSFFPLHGVKELAGIARPAGVLSADAFQLIGVELRARAFPSGHTTSTFVFAAALFLAVTSSRWRAVIIGAAVLIAFSRVAVGAHWPADVFAGAALGWVSGLLGGILAAHRWPSGTRSSWQLFLAMIPAIAWLTLPTADLGYETRWLQVVLALAILAAVVINLWQIKPWRDDDLHAFFGDPASLAKLLIIGLAVLQLLVGAAAPLGADESHYALYGYFPALSYFDHPPMVGWLQWLVLHLSDKDLALRLWPIFLMALSNWALYRLAMRLYGERSRWSGLLAVGLLQAGLIVHLSGIGMLPEVPLLLFGLLAAHALLSIVEGDRRAWLWLGLMLGLAGLSKYTAVLLLPGILLVLIQARRLDDLRTVWPWVSALLAAALVAPVFIWNAQNDWASFAYQIHHGTGGAWSLSTFVQAQAGQFLAYSPAVYLLGVIALVGAARRGGDPADRFLLLLAAPILLVFAYNGGNTLTLPHWTLLGWALAAPLAAQLLIRVWSRRWVRWGVGASVAYALLFIVAFHVLVQAKPMVFPEGQHPLGEIIGWDKAAKRGLKLLDEMPEPLRADATLMTERWTIASRMAWNARPHPVRVIQRRNRQFDYWYGEPEPGQNAVLIVWSRTGGGPESWSKPRFDRCVWREKMPVMVKSTRVAEFDFYECRGFIR